MGRTDNFNLSTLGPGTSLSNDGFKYSVADRETLDRLLGLIFDHVHDGSALGLTDPIVAPSLTLDNTFGALPPATRVYYKYTLVNAAGTESGPSPEAFIDTPSQVVAPGAPTPVRFATGGTHLPGTYFYVLSAYTATTNQETKALNPVSITIPSGTTNRVALTMPSLPSGATAFNIYRRKPGAPNYVYLASTGVGTYNDDNSIAEDPNRTVPNGNTTNFANSVEVSFPGATPVVPDGFTWKVYRTYITSNYQNSLLHWVVEETFEGSGVITPELLDVGEGTTTGAPPETSPVFSMPDPIDLADGLEITGRIPPGNVAVYPFMAEFTFSPGDVGEGLNTWVCPYPEAIIKHARAHLGKDEFADEVICDVHIYRPGMATPAWVTIFTTQANRPTVPAGEQAGVPTVSPDITDMVQGDLLVADIDDIVEGATPAPVPAVVVVEVFGWAIFNSLVSDNPDWE